jgi:hypothetical protein
MSFINHAAHDNAEDHFPLRRGRVDLLLTGNEVHPQRLELLQGVHQRSR